tara:strand:- start:20808 stop:22016 length:1209 start_codon:yes stop_codon:yes gene_type:complete
MNKCEPIEAQSPFYYSLLGAVNHFGLTPNEIIDMAIEGEIILSIKISKEYSPYLMSTLVEKDTKAFDFLTFTKKSLKEISMLPRKVNASHLNLSKGDCEILKVSNLDKSSFESAFIECKEKYVEHKLLRHDFDIKVNLSDGNFNEQQTKDYIRQLDEMLSGFSPENRKRFRNGLSTLRLAPWARRFTLIESYSDFEDDGGDVEFIGSSLLSQINTRDITIPQNDIVISSNYKEVLEQYKSVETIPESSPYFVKPELREFNGLYTLAEIGYQYFVVEENKLVEPLKELLSSKSVGPKKTIEAAVFFLNPKPHHKADLHNSTKAKGCRCQFIYLIDEAGKYWLDKKIDVLSDDDIHKCRIAFAEVLYKVGYSHEKAIHGEFLSLPNKLKLNEGVGVLNINKVFP